MSESVVNPLSAPEDRVRVGTTLREVFVRLWPHFMKQKALFWATIGSVFALAVAGRSAVAVFGWAIDEGILKKDRDFIVIAALAYFLLEVGRSVMNFMHTFLFARLGNRVLFEIRDELLRHVQHLPISYFDRNPSGRIVTRLTNDVVALGELFTQGLITVFASLVSLVAIVFAMSAISIKMTIATLMIAPPLLWLVSRLSARVLDAQRKSKAKLAAINAYVAENIGGMRILQLYNRVGKNTETFRSLSADYRAQQFRTVRSYALLWPTTSFFNAASVGAALYFGGKFALEGSVTTGAMVAFILHVRAFMDPLHMIIEKYQVLQNSLSSAERIFTLFDEPVEQESMMTSPITKVRGEIEFRNVSFRYAPHLPKALDQVSFKIHAGQSVAFVGRTGSGKSTSIALMQRMYDPTEGEIFVDGRPVASIARGELRTRVGVVQQDTFMFRGTIADNISLADPAVSRARVEEAARGARLEAILSRHAKGLEGHVEERGANLSFGERQLIAFARILAFNPDILILDEATANIDSRTEQLIQEATRKVRQGRTSFIIAHRISTIVDCDKIIVLDHGKIAEFGSHRELFEKNGIYRQLCDAQAKEHSDIIEPTPVL